VNKHKDFPNKIYNKSQWHSSQWHSEATCLANKGYYYICTWKTTNQWPLQT
jgi:hypothetical protein